MPIVRLVEGNGAIRRGRLGVDQGRRRTTKVPGELFLIDALERSGRIAGGIAVLVQQLDGRGW